MDECFVPLRIENIQFFRNTRLPNSHPLSCEVNLNLMWDPIVGLPRRDTSTLTLGEIIVHGFAVPEVPLDEGYPTQPAGLTRT